MVYPHAMNGTSIAAARRGSALFGALLAAILLVALLVLARPAAAQTDPYPVQDPPEDPSDPNEVLGAKFERGRPSDPAGVAGLPITGGDVIGLTVVGLSLIGAGVIVLRVRKQTTPA